MVRYSEINEAYNRYGNSSLLQQMNKYYSLTDPTLGYTDYTDIDFSLEKLAYEKDNKVNILRFSSMPYLSLRKSYNQSHLPPIRLGVCYCNVALNNPNLTSLATGLPEIVNGILDVVGSPLQSLEGIEKCKMNTFRFSYSKSLPMLRLLTLDCDVITDDAKGVGDKGYIIIEKYKEDKSMTLSEKRIRCKLELLEYPEYGLNAEW